MSMPAAALDYARKHREVHLNELKEFLRMPSISTLPEHKEDVQNTADWLAEQLSHLGFQDVQVIPTKGHPVVYGERMTAPGRPTVLVYGHYDVQPADPLDEWTSPPFEPTERDGYLHARGASDMKSQIFAQLKAVESIVSQDELPVNVKYILEGEEEIGSPHLEQFLEEHRALLACDMVLNCDSGILGPDQPGLVYSLRGLAYFELRVFGPEKDLHSGLFGGVVHNPAQVLCELLAGLHDAEGRVTLPGFYDKVLPLADDERSALAAVGRSDDEWKRMSGAPALWGEAGYTPTERVGGRPTLEINGLLSGFTGAGSKTVLPARAMAKISCRLVANQDPLDVQRQLRQYVEAHMPPTVRWELDDLAGAPAGYTDRDTVWMKAAQQALKTVFEKDPIFWREGGTIPIVGLMKEKLGVDTVLMGFALPDDGIHGPNERQRIENFYNGIETYIHFLYTL